MAVEAPVSVIIPVFNGSAVIGDALRSVYAQSRPPEQVIVADDGSTDDTGLVVEGFERATFLRLPHRGPAEARNAGARLATKPFLAFLDADDIWPEARLERQLAMLQEHPEIDFVSGCMVLFRMERDGTRRELSTPIPTNLPTTLLMRREAFWKVGEFLQHWEVGETIEWWSRVIDAGLQGAALSDVVLFRRAHTDNLSRTTKAPYRSYLQMLHAVVNRRRSSQNS